MHIYAISKHYFQYFNKLCEERIYFWKSFGCSPKQIYNGNFRKHSRAALDKMKLYQMGNKTKNLDLAWIYCKWRKLHKPLLDPPPPPHSWVAIKLGRCQEIRDINNFCKTWNMNGWPAVMTDKSDQYVSNISIGNQKKKLFAIEVETLSEHTQIIKKYFSQEMVSWNPNYLRRTIPLKDSYGVDKYGHWYNWSILGRL